MQYHLFGDSLQVTQWKEPRVLALWLFPIDNALQPISKTEHSWAKLLGITILTSWTQESMCSDLLIDQSIDQRVKHLAGIAFYSGFSSLSYFSKSYKDEFGLPPNVKLNKTRINLELKEFIRIFFEEKKSFVLLISIFLHQKCLDLVFLFEKFYTQVFLKN